MKVVIPVASLETGGGCKGLADIANALHDHGHETEIVIPKKAPITYELRCKVSKVPYLSKETIPYGDIVLPNFYTTFLPAYEAWPRQCVRLCQGFEPLWVNDKDFAIWTYTRNVPTISISSWLDDQIFKHTKQRSIVVNPGIDPDIFYPSANVQKNPRLQKTILYIARDPKLGYSVKGYDDFVKSTEIFNQKYQKRYIVYMICPESPLPLPGIPHKIFNPKSDPHKMADLYRNADVFVSTSRSEGFGLPPLESMACATPVVTTNSGGIFDFCHHLKSAYITQQKDPQSIADGMFEVLTNEQLATSLVEGGLEQAKKLTRRHFEQNIIKAFEDIHATLNNRFH